MQSPSRLQDFSVLGGGTDILFDCTKASTAESTLAEALQSTQGLRVAACNCQPCQCVQELGAIERPLPAEASTSSERPNDMGCCAISCLDYDILAPTPSPSPAAAPQLALLPVPLTITQTAPVRAPLASRVPADSASPAAAAGPGQADQSATAVNAAPMLAESRGVPGSTAGVLRRRQLESAAY